MILLGGCQINLKPANHGHNPCNLYEIRVITV